MSMQFTPPSLIGANSTNVTNKAFMDKEDAARAAGPVMQYEYKSHKPKKQLKEIMKVLKPETKTFLKVPYKFKYNIKDRCVVCGTHKVWEAGDNLRPPLPLHKGRQVKPLRASFCDKNAAIHSQYEMLEQQILAEEHGLSFSAYIPKAPSMPTTLNPLASGPLTSLKATDIASLSSLGWTIKPPASNEESKEEELFRLTVESDAVNSRVKTLLTEGTKVPVVESEQ